MMLSGVSDTAALKVAEAVKRPFIDMNALSAFPVSTFSRSVWHVLTHGILHIARLFFHSQDTLLWCMMRLSE